MSSRGVAVQLLQPHPASRWVLPLGLVCVVVLAAITLLLPNGVAGTVFGIGRFVFLIGYLALVGVATSRTRRATEVSVDEAGLHEPSGTLAERRDFKHVIVTRANGISTIEVRAQRPLWLELASETAAAELVAALDPAREQRTTSFLATTTPIALVAVAWMGIPALMAMVAMPLLQGHPSPSTLLALAVPGIMVWLFCSGWCMRRRRISISASELLWPRLLSNQLEAISLGEVTDVTLQDPFTIVIAFSSRSAKRCKIYDPALVADFVDRLRDRAHVSPP